MRRIIILLLITASAVAAEKSVLPLAVGNRWDYAVTQYGVMSSGEGKRSRSMEMASQGTCVEEVISIKEKRKDGVVYEYRSITKTDAGLNTDPSEVIEDTLMLASDKGIAITASKASGMGDLFSNEWAKYDPPLISFAFGLKPGSKWKIGTVREGNLRMPMEAQVTGVETVTVPAGTFENCLKIYVTCSKVTGTMGSGADMATIKSGKSVNTVWMHPSVGVVKEQDILQAKMQFVKGPLMTGTQRKVKELLPGYRAQPGNG
jgi:hypothetical protein